MPQKPSGPALLFALLLLAAPLAAQPVLIPSTLVFTIDDLTLANSGGGLAGNEAATFNDEAILMTSPSIIAPYFAYACADAATWSAYFGDEDSDGSYVDAIVGTVDALYIPPGAGDPVNLFDVFVSFSSDVEAGGINGASGTTIDDGDVVRLLPRGGVIPFVTRDQLAMAMGTTSTTIDVNAFCVDGATGDVYWSMTATQTVNGTAVLDGGVVRLPGTGYVANPDGTVAAVTPGAAEIVLTEGEINGFFVTAGLNGVTDVSALELDPLGGTFVSAGGFTLPNLLIADDDDADGPTVITTRIAPQVLIINGIVFDNGNAWGLQNTDLFGGTVGNVHALAFRFGVLATTPRYLSTFPLGVATPGPMTIDLAGMTPGSSVLLLAKTGDVSTVGGFTYRWSIFLSSLPMFDVPGGFDELYLNDNTDPIFLASLLFPPVPTDAEGYGSVTFNLPALTPGIGFAFQAVDPANLALSTPVIPAMQ